MKKRITLTSEEFMDYLNKAFNEALNEIDGRTQARVPNAVRKARELNQSGQNTTDVINGPDSPIVHDRVIDKAIDTGKRDNASLITPFSTTTFVFYATDRTGLTTFVTFKPQGIKKLLNGVAILTGEVVYKRDLMSGNITVDFNKGKVFYTDGRTRYKYELEPDNRTVSGWNALLAELKASLDNRI